jgi:hypothetical protein
MCQPELAGKPASGAVDGAKSARRAPLRRTGPSPSSDTVRAQGAP